MEHLLIQQDQASLRSVWRFCPESRYSVITVAGVAELADAQDLGSCGRKAVGVQIPPSAPKYLFRFHLVHGPLCAVYLWCTLRLRLRFKLRERIAAPDARNIGL